MRKRWWLVGVVLLIAFPLMFLLRDFAREVLVLELLRVAWALGIVLDSLPQTPLWWLFIALVAFLSLRSLIGRIRLGRQKPETVEEHPGGVRLLASRIRRAGEGEYFRWNLARDLGRRALEVLAYKEQTSVAQLKKRLDKDSLDAPPEVESYIRSGQAPIYSLSAGFAGRFGRFLPSGLGMAAAEQDVERIVEFMEEQLEAVDDSRVG